MPDRIQRALDGELPEALLTPDEARALRSYRDAVTRGLSSLPDEPPPDVSREVARWAADVEPLPCWVPAVLARPWLGLARAARWSWAPHPVRLRPAPLLAAAAALAVLAWFGAERRVASPPAPVLVQFRLASPEARRVALVGDFNGWRPQHPLHEIAPGVWSVAVPLRPGVYDYAFVLDGRTWHLDPLAPRVQDGFGGANSRVTVVAPGAEAREL